MLIKRFKVQVIDAGLKNYLVERGQPFSYIVVANSRASAWRKYCTQYFGIQKPNRSEYDISLDSTLDTNNPCPVDDGVKEQQT